MLARDEADIIEHTLRHLKTQVDWVFVADNMSTDGTRDILNSLAWTDEAWLDVSDDLEPGYFQDRKTTALALQAYERGFDWVIPCDADEIWYSPFGRVGDILDVLPEEVLFARAVMFNHIPTNQDQPESDPVKRIGWRFIEPGAMSKVACRTSPDLRIDMGNHEAVSVGKVRSNWMHNVHGQITIRHFPWRSQAQHLRKITNGALAYAAAPDLDPTYGEHWKAFGLPGTGNFEQAVNDWFWQWGFRANPGLAGDLIYDPAPGG